MAKKNKNRIKKELTDMITTLETSKGDQIVPHLEVTEKEEDELEEETPEQILEKLDTEQDLTGVKHVPSFMQEGESEGESPANVEDESAEMQGEEQEVSLEEIPAEAEEQTAENAETESIEKEEEQAAVEPPIPVKPKKIYEPTGNLWGDVGVFMEELVDSYAERYDIWEESTNQVLSVLRDLQMVNEENSEILVETIGNVHEKLRKGLRKFKQKRDYVEKISNSNYQETARTLKRTLDLLSLQLKEIKLKNLLNQLYEIYV